MATAVIDFETFWDSKSYTLSKMGPIEYIRDDRFATQMMAFTNMDGGNPVLFEGDDIPKALRFFLNKHEDGVLLGHNISAFDALILSERYGIQPPRVWDTMSMAYWTGVARVSGNSHAALTRTLGNGEKKPGTVTSDGKHWPEDFTESERQFFRTYCCDDARQCAWNANVMLDDMTPDALRFMEITARMAYAPAFVVDADKLNQFLRQLDTELDDAYQQVCKLFAFQTRESFQKAVRSAQTFAYMLRACDCEPPMKESEAKTKTLKDKLTAQYNLAMAAGDMDKAGEAADKLNDFTPVMTYAFAKTDLPFLDLLDHPDPRVRLLVETRLNHNSSINRSRAETLLKFADGRPIPIILRAFAAHTSRYTAGGLGGASDGLQFQNLSKRDPSKKLLREAIRAPEGYAVVACDSSQIEARCLAWLANETDLVDQFRQGRDPYSELAEKIFHIPANEIHDGAKSGDKKLKQFRNVGKTAILSCLAGTTEVLTDTGWKPITSVTLTDKLWDGEEWVQHEGLMYNGLRNIISVGGVEMTPDHMIFDGSSWRAAAELLAEPRSLTSAMSYAAASLQTVPLNTEQTRSASSIMCSVRTARAFNGRTVSRLSEEVSASIAHIVRHAMRAICVVTSGVAPTLRLVLVSGNSQSLVTNGAILQGRGKNPVWNTAHWCSVPVVRSHTGFCSPIYGEAAQHGVMHAQKRRHARRRISIIGSTLSLFLTRRCVGGFLTASLRVLRGVLQRATSAKLGNIMAGVVSGLSSLTGGVFSPISLRCPGTTTRTSSLTASTRTETTQRETCVSFPAVTTCSTSGTSATCNGSLTHGNTADLCFDGALEPCSINSTKVYDLKNSGPRNRFLIRRGTTILMAHNCGYGVGAQKFADTLRRSGSVLDENPDRHTELAYNAHATYRAANPAIVAFWRVCQSVIEAMAGGYEGSFGGPNGNTFFYGPMPIIGTSYIVPSIRMPSGFILRYPNLRTSDNNYVYDKMMPGGKMSTVKLYGGALCENCIAEGTLVLTQRGWITIESVQNTDVVWDGAAFVPHDGVVCNGVRPCINVAGVWMTPDHRVWERGEWVYGQSAQRPDRAEVWTSGCDCSASQQWREMVVDVCLRLRRNGCALWYRCAEIPRKWCRACLRFLRETEAESYAFTPWFDQDSHMECLAFHGGAVHTSNVSCVPTLRGAWNICLRTVERVRKLLRRYVPHIQARLGVGQNRQQRAVLAGELPVDYIQGECPEQGGHIQGCGCCGIEQENRNRNNHAVLQDYAWMANRRFNCSAQSGEHQETRGTVQKKVFDITNCGPRHQFVVSGDYPFTVHNCTQGFAFQVLMWQACRMDEAGVPLHANIHDSFACVAPEQYVYSTAMNMTRCMSLAPDWAPGLPIACETEIGHDFTVV